MTQAILLRAVPYAEADRVVTLFGLDTGRVSALARGARKSQRRFSGGLGLGATGHATLRDRPGAELMSLELFDVTHARLGLGADLGRTAHAAYAVELCDRLCGARQPEPGVFAWLDEFLSRLEQDGAKLPRMRVFELGLLRLLGVGPALVSCVACGRSDLGDETARWQPERGGLLCSACARQGALLTADTRRALARLAALTLAEADRDPLSEDENTGCRRAILTLLEVHGAGALKSLAFIAKMGGAA